MTPLESRAAGTIAVALFNDTADNPHVGCLAVSQAHRRMLRRAGARVRHAFFCREWHQLGAGDLEDAIAAALGVSELREVFAEVDAVVVNGEGTIHHGYGRHLVAILGAAQRLGLPTYLLNAVLQDTDDARPVLAALTDCTVRDACSARYLRGLGIPHRLVPDSFFEADFLDTPRHDFRDRLVITDSHPARAAEHAAALAGLRHAWKGRCADYPLESLERVDDWQHALADIRDADAVVTGRHHGACLALLAGVPFVTLPSNTWKVEGLIEQLEGYPVEAADPARPLIERLAAARNNRHWFRDASVRIRQQLPLPTFDRLSAGRPAAIPIEHGGRRHEQVLDAIRLTARPGGGVLHVGCGRGSLVAALLREGYDASGVDVAASVVGVSAQVPLRCTRAEPDSLPFDVSRFATVAVRAEWLEHLEDDELTAALADIMRVSGDVVIVETSGRPRRSHQAVSRGRTRTWWEQRLFAAGLRRHPRWIEPPVYETADAASAATCLVMQRARGVQGEAGTSAVRNLPGGALDHLRRSGQDCDTHGARYAWASSWIKPGDVVVDLHCGAGEGTAMLRDVSEAARVIGVDSRPAALEYARIEYGASRPNVAFILAAADVWDRFDDHSVDVVVTLDPDSVGSEPSAFLPGVSRVLKPGGRFLCAASQSLHETLQSPSCVLIIDTIHAQADGTGGGSPTRGLVPIDPAGARVTQGACWLISAIKDPVAGRDVPYTEQAFPAEGEPVPNAIAFERDYVNPWAVHALVMGSFRVRSPRLLRELAARWLHASAPASADAGAALCILAYRQLESPAAAVTGELIARITEYCAMDAANPQMRRWQISLRFVEGLLRMREGDLDGAERALHSCARQNASLFSPHLETKTTEAAWLAGRLALERGDHATAESEWREGLAILDRVKSASVRDWVITPGRPAAFECGDGLREIAIVIDNAARCANGLRALADRSGGWRQSLRRLDRSFQTNTAGLIREIQRRGGEIAALRDAQARWETTEQKWRRTLDALRTEHRHTETRMRQLTAERNTLAKRLTPAAGVRVGIFGAGAGGLKVWQAIAGIPEADVAWFADNNPERQGATLFWSPVIAPSALSTQPFDAIVVASTSADAIRAQLWQLGVPPDRILCVDTSAPVERIRTALMEGLAQLAVPVAR